MRLLAEDEPHPAIVRAGMPDCPFVLVASIVLHNNAWRRLARQIDALAG